MQSFVSLATRARRCIIFQIFWVLLNLRFDAVIVVPLLTKSTLLDREFTFLGLDAFVRIRSGKVVNSYAQPQISRRSI